MLHAIYQDRFAKLDAISSKCCCAYSCSENVYMGCLLNGSCGYIHYNGCLNVLDDALFWKSVFCHTAIGKWEEKLGNLLFLTFARLCGHLFQQ